MTEASKDKPVIGLVGGVGAGKSTAAARLAALGCAVIDADQIGHEVLATEGVRQAVRTRWPDVPLDPDGQIDRRALGRIVFADPRALADLNAIMHPEMGREIARRIASARESAPAVVLDAAVLFEAGWDALCTHLVFVDAPAAERVRHVAGRGWDEATWQGREKSQISLDTKRGKCDYVLGNHSDLAYLNKQIDQFFHRIVCSH
ncbi:MAG: dephospho-CoA kinase [Planctomycetota bacterium]|nr:dephospho-CoA kinase [Planctomycetota bacterium]